MQIFSKSAHLLPISHSEMPSFFERVLRAGGWTTKIGPLKLVAPTCGHVYGADTFLPPTFQYSRAGQPGHGGVALQFAGRYGARAASTASSRLRQLRDRRERRFVVGRPYLWKRRVATNMTPTEITNRLNITRIAWTAFIFTNTLTKSPNPQHSVAMTFWSAT